MTDNDYDGPITRMARELRALNVPAPAMVAAMLFNEIIDVVAMAGKAVTVEVPGPGAVVTYRGRLTITNPGPGTVRHVSLADLKFVSARSVD